MPDDDTIDLDLSGIQIITSLENLGGIGTSIGDETPIRLSVKIPEFTLEAGVTNGWSGLLDGEPTVGATTLFKSPMINAVNSFKNALTNLGVQSLQMGGSGLTIDDNDDPFVFNIDSTDMVVEDDTESELRGDVTFIMPDGITLEGFQTANGWEKVEDEDGRQKITISLESFAAGDEFTFSVVISWWFILSQIWIYPTILISLIVWRVRARRRKKKRKRELAAASEEDEDSNLMLIIGIVVLVIAGVVGAILFMRKGGDNMITKDTPDEFTQQLMPGQFKAFQPTHTEAHVSAPQQVVAQVAAVATVAVVAAKSKRRAKSAAGLRLAESVVCQRVHPTATVVSTDASHNLAEAAAAASGLDLGLFLFLSRRALWAHHRATKGGR